MNYNYLLKLGYRDCNNDTIYRKELLNVFGMKEYDDDIIAEKMDLLYNNVKDSIKECIHFIIKNNQFPFELSDFICFQLLFSWEHFFETHQYLRDLFDKKINNYDILLEHLKKTKNK